MSDWAVVGVSWAVMVVAASLMIAFARGAQIHQPIDKQEIIDARYDHCRMVWGDSEYFEPCMRGLTITPTSDKL